VIVQFFKQESRFLYLITLLVIIAAFIFNVPKIAMWFGFAVAGYSAIANDSIQTLGTFLTSNKKKPWWLLWIFIGGILISTNIYGYLKSGGAVHFDRLESIPQPTSFTFIQLLTPIVLIILTRLKMPVSTSFLLLSIFSSVETIKGMLIKTFIGYIVAFICAFILWTVISKWIKRTSFKTDNPPETWYILQWITTGFLWSQWLMHDTANIAVFLPRTITPVQFGFFLFFLFIIVGYLMYIRGDKIQEIVSEKKDINNVRSATVVDFVYAIILMYFKDINNLPMSTTWVFLGLLAGRELALTESVKEGDEAPFKRSFKLVGKDIMRAAIGLAVSLIFAILVGDTTV